MLVEQNVNIASANSERAYVLSLGRVVNEIGRGGWAEFLNTDTLIDACLGRRSGEDHVSRQS
jgi:ABC-type branched-subunit amino acid transport system ATPase component